MREVDSDTVARSIVVVDTLGGAMAEAGDLIQPMKEGQIQEDHICAELKDLLSGNHHGRTSESDITLFKSVGCAAADYAAALLVAGK